MSFLKNFVRGEVNRDFVPLEVGTHMVIVDEIAETNDRQKSWRDGTMKTEDLPEWTDVHDQLAVKFKKRDENGKTVGVITTRFNTCGFKRYAELPEEDRESYFMSGNEGYAVHHETKERLEDPERTSQCLNIFNELFASAKVPVGTKGVTAIVGKPLMIDVYADTFNGKTTNKVKGYKAITEAVSEAIPETTQEY